MKVSKEATFEMTPEELGKILLEHFKKDIGLSTEVPHPFMFYNEKEDTYKFSVTFEKGEVHE